MCRGEFLDKVKNLVEHGVSVNIYGERGIGKTTILKMLPGYYFPSPRLTKNQLQRMFNSNGTINEMLQKLLEQERTIIKIDDCDNLTKNQARLVNCLSKKHSLILASEQPLTIENVVNLEVPRLSIKECERMLGDHPLASKIIKKSDHNPSKILFMKQHYLATRKLPENDKRFNGVDLNVLTTSLFSIRYLFMFTQQWNLYGLFSMIAYALATIKRYKRK